MADETIKRLVDALAKEFGDEAEVAGVPVDETYTADDKLVIRVVLDGWEGLEHELGTGDPTIGRMSVGILLRASWRNRDFDTIRPDNRRVIRVLERLAWQFQGMDHGGTDDYLDSVMSFTQLEAAPY